MRRAACALCRWRPAAARRRARAGVRSGRRTNGERRERNSIRRVCVFVCVLTRVGQIVLECSPRRIDARAAGGPGAPLRVSVRAHAGLVCVEALVPLHVLFGRLALPRDAVPQLGSAACEALAAAAPRCSLVGLCDPARQRVVCGRQRICELLPDAESAAASPREPVRVHLLTRRATDAPSVRYTHGSLALAGALLARCFVPPDASADFVAAELDADARQSLRARFKALSVILERKHQATLMDEGRDSALINAWATRRDDDERNSIASRRAPTGVRSGDDRSAPVVLREQQWSLPRRVSVAISSTGIPVLDAYGDALLSDKALESDVHSQVTQILANDRKQRDRLAKCVRVRVSESRSPAAPLVALSRCQTASARTVARVKRGVLQNLLWISSLVALCAVFLALLLLKEKRKKE